MISVEKKFNKPPQSLINRDCIEIIKKCLHEKGAHKFKSHYKKKDTKKALIEIYNGKKCAYCEGTPATTSPIQVEHYRPKKKCRKKIPTHQGYYWLGYEWTNLLYACGNCNNSKGNQFPLDDTGIRITSPPFLNKNLDVDKCKIDSTHLLNEKPLLLNPEVDSPEDHIIFLLTGEAFGITPKGKETIEICKLNRDDLIVLGRKKLIDKFYKMIERDINNYLSDSINSIKEETLDYCLKNIFTDLRNLRLPENEFSRLGFFMFEKFNLFFAKRFGEKTQQLLMNKYESYKIEIGLKRKLNS